MKHAGRSGSHPHRPLPLPLPRASPAPIPCASPNGWAIGVDPDTSGAITVLSLGCSSQVFDNPFVHIVVSEVVQKRLDTKSIIQLLRGLDAPPGTTAYIEKSSPFPTDGKLGEISRVVAEKFSAPGQSKLAAGLSLRKCPRAAALGYQGPEET